MALENKRFAVLVEDLYEDQELWYPARRLAEAGADVVIVGSEAGEVYKSKYGYPAPAAPRSRFRLSGSFALPDVQS
jgi:protease I